MPETSTQTPEASLSSLSSLSIHPKSSLPEPPLPLKPLSEIQNIALHVQPPTTIKPIPPNFREVPFQFGSRYLTPDSSLFSENAWDHVDPSTDTLYTSYAAAQYAFQRTHAVSAFDARRYNTAPEKRWDRFYSNNESNFFKDRKWLRQEFPVLSECTAAPREDNVQGWERKNVILEVGAGAGNTVFPILAGNANPKLMIHACDFSKKAVGLIRANACYDERHVRAEVWDVASETETLPPGVEPGSVDVVVMVFVFSALEPRQWAQAVRNVWRALRPGGEICFRDYGRGDLAQVRFKKGRLLEENFYVRGDFTRVYFFEEEELREIWGRGHSERETKAEEKIVGGEDDNNNNNSNNRNENEMSKSIRESEADRAKEAPSISNIPSQALTFQIVSLGADRRLLINRQKQLKMYRCWMQGRFRKPEGTEGASHESA